MLRALYEREIVPEFVVATSAGALNAAFIASRPQTVQTADALGEIWRGLRRGQVFPVNLLTGLLGFLGARDHLVPEGAMRRLITRHIEHDRLEQMPLELHVIAVDVITGEEVRLSRGPAVDAVMASAAIPAVLPPTLRRLIDDIEPHQDAAKMVVLPPPCPLAIQPIDFGHAGVLIDRAYADACEFLDNGGAERARPTGDLRDRGRAR